MCWWSGCRVTVFRSNTVALGVVPLVCSCVDSELLLYWDPRKCFFGVSQSKGGKPRGVDTDVDYDGKIISGTILRRYTRLHFVSFTRTSFDFGK
jgi:hypothetical protein